MTESISLKSGKAAQITFFKAPVFPENSFREIKDLYRRMGVDQMTVAEEAELERLKKLTGFMVVKMDHVDICDFQPVAFRYVQTAATIHWGDMTEIFSWMEGKNAELLADGPVNLWDDIYGIYGDD